MRLERVGGRVDLVSDDAVTVRHEASQGAHRDLDRLATEALRLAARRGKHRVDGGLAERVCAADSVHNGDRS